MKRQNSVYLCGRVADVRAESVHVGGLAQTMVFATVITDHPAYGGHHQVLFIGNQSQELLDFWELTGGNLEVVVEGWLRSASVRDTAGVARDPAGVDGDRYLATAVVVVDRVLFLSVTQEQRDAAARRKALRRQSNKQSEKEGDG